VHLALVLLQLHPAVDLHWRHWDSDWVVFDTASGFTHQMDELSACALRCIEGGPLTDATLIAELAIATGIPDDEVRRAVEPVIERLSGLGLIEAVPQ
jgi:PqqD family protein of HPr-rel-A system